VDLYIDVVEQYERFAEDARGESPCFTAWASGVAGDAEVLTWISGLPPVKRQPNIVFAAARWHGVPAPGPYAGLRAALLADDGSIRATIMARSTQTNEVGRLATLVPLLRRIQVEADRPLALVEVGASAGLCLHPDRFGYRWTTDDGRAHDWSPVPGQDAGSARAPVLTSRVHGVFEPPGVDEDLDVAWRTGLDLHPVDVTDPEQAAWLDTLVWPEQEHRRARLRAAIEVASADPPRMVRGDLRRDVPDLVAEAAEHGRVVVFHSAVVAYLEPADRELFHALMTDLVRSGACRWVSNEGRQVLPQVAATAGLSGRPEDPPYPGPQQGREVGRGFVLGLDGQALAWTHGHGASMTWM
jgi:hypothetical protein